MKIKKFRLISERPEESTFLVKKIKKVTTFFEEHIISDDQGNLISSRDSDGRKFKTNTKESEGIVAYSLPSQTPAHVEILETEEGVIGDPDKSEKEINKIKNKENIENKKPNLINLSDFMNSDRSQKPMIIPKTKEIHWADN